MTKVAHMEYVILDYPKDEFDRRLVGRLEMGWDVDTIKFYGTLQQRVWALLKKETVA